MVIGAPCMPTRFCDARSTMASALDARAEGCHIHSCRIPEVVCSNIDVE